jgi:hypothetical protein
MAKLMLIGEAAHVELTSDPEDDQTIATCVGHVNPNPLDSRLIVGCTWRLAYATLNDAAEYAADHADGQD